MERIRRIQHASRVGGVLKSLGRAFAEAELEEAFSLAQWEVPSTAHVHELARGVDRFEARELIFVVVSEAAMAASIGPAEQTVLDELRELWGLEERTVL